MQRKAVSRRGFLKASVALSGAMASGSAVIAGCSRKSDSAYRNLTPDEGRLLEILADLIIPPDPQTLGGKAAGVPHFIDQQLGEHLSGVRELYRVCLPALNETSKARHEAPFIELDEGGQVSYLTDIEAGVYDTEMSPLWGEHTPSAFFSQLVDHCMMGFYGNPQHGGNRDYASYKMLGLRVEQVPTFPGGTNGQ